MSAVLEGAAEFPDGWEWQTLGDACEPVATRKPEEEPDREFRYIDISSINRDTLTIESPQLLLGRDAPSRARQVVQTGDVLFSTVRPNLRTIAVVPPELDGQVASTGFCVLRPRGLSSEFLFLTVISSGFLGRVIAKARGVSYPAVRDRDIREEQIAVPPRDQQDRIVSMIGGLMDQMSDGTARLANADAALSKFRASVLSAGVDGRLDGSGPDDEDGAGLLARVLERREDAWRAAGMCRYAEAALPAAPAFQLPTGWVWATVDQLAVGVQYGSSAKTAADEGVPVLRMGNIVNGRLGAWVGNGSGMA